MLSPAPTHPAAPRLRQRSVPAHAAAPILDLAPARAQAGGVGAVVGFATFGAAWVVFALVGWGRWILSDRFSPQPKGPDTLSTAHRILIHGYEVVALTLLITMVTIYLVKPWIRTRRLSLDGMLLIGSTFAFFQDPVINIFRYTFGWNAYAINMGSWGSFIPGSQGSQNYGEGLAWAWPDYIVFGVIGAVSGCWLLAWLKKHFPRLSTPAAFGIFFVVFFLAASILENLRVRFELYSYARTFKPLTLWAGNYYQWPLYEGVLGAFGATAFLFVRWSWLTRGRSFVDAGIERLRVTERTRRGVLLLAVIGFAGAAWLVLWFAPWALQSLGADSIAHLPSYMQQGP
jgi:hypothetical protein